MRQRFIFLRFTAALLLAFPAAPVRMALAQAEPLASEVATAAQTSSGLPDFTRQMDLSLAEAKQMAMDNNLDLENARRDLKLAELEITRAKAGYDPYIQADASYSNSKRPSSQAVFGQTSESASVNLSSGITTVTGGSMSVDFRNSRSESDSVFSTLNPSYSTDLTLNVRQPILKNRFNDTRAMDLEQKNNDMERARLSLESKTFELEAQVEDAYWSLVRARMDLSLKRSSFELSQRMNDMTAAQVRAGAAPAVSTLQTEANLASARATVIRSENDYRKSQASLKMVMNIIDQDIWSLEIIPTDLPSYEPPDFNRDEVIAESLANNIGLRQTKLNIANTEISNLQAKNRVMPQLDVRGSVGVSGLAGTDNPSDQVVETGFVVPNPLPADQFPQPYMVERTVIAGQESEQAGDYVDAVENMMEGDNLSWSAGVTFNMPIGNRAAKTDLERTMINYEKLISDLDNQKRQVFLNLINLVYDLEAAHRGFLAAQEADKLQQKNLETEERKFELGLNTTYEVLQARENFEEARSGEIGALIEYTKAKGRMDRARKGYVSGGSVSAAIPLNISSITSMGGGLPSGVDAGMLQQYASMLPAGIDISQLQSLLP